MRGFFIEQYAYGKPPKAYTARYIHTHTLPTSPEAAKNTNPVMMIQRMGAKKTFIFKYSIFVAMRKILTITAAVLLIAFPGRSQQRERIPGSVFYENIREAYPSISRFYFKLCPRSVTLHFWSVLLYTFRRAK